MGLAFHKAIYYTSPKKWGIYMVEFTKTIYMESGKYNLSKDLTKVSNTGEQLVKPNGIYSVVLKSRMFYIMRYIDILANKEDNYALLTKIDGKLVNVLLDDYDLLNEYAAGKQYSKDDFNANAMFTTHLSKTQIICFRDLLDKLRFSKYTHHVVVPTFDDSEEVLTDSAFVKVKSNDNELVCKDAMFKALSEKLELLEQKITIKIKENATGYIRSYSDDGYIRNQQVYLLPGKHVYIPEYINCDSMDDYKESEKARVMFMPDLDVSDKSNSAYCYNFDGSLISSKLTRNRKQF